MPPLSSLRGTYPSPSSLGTDIGTPPVHHHPPSDRCTFASLYHLITFASLYHLITTWSATTCIPFRKYSLKIASWPVTFFTFAQSCRVVWNDQKITELSHHHWLCGSNREIFVIPWSNVKWFMYKRDLRERENGEAWTLPNLEVGAENWSFRLCTQQQQQAFPNSLTISWMNIWGKLLKLKCNTFNSKYPAENTPLINTCHPLAVMRPLAPFFSCPALNEILA